MYVALAWIRRWPPTVIAIVTPTDHDVAPVEHHVVIVGVL